MIHVKAVQSPAFFKKNEKVKLRNSLHIRQEQTYCLTLLFEVQLIFQIYFWRPNSDLFEA